MRTLAAITLGMLATAPAFAGGVGLIGNAGFHTEKVYWYSTETLDGGAPIAEEVNYEQVLQSQNILNAGGGVEFMLGDRDDKVQGVFRFYYNRDSAQADPATRTSLVPADSVVSNERTQARSTGMASVGLNWGIVGDTNGFMLGLSVHIGSGFLTNDDTEYLMAQAGPTISYRLSREFTAFADITYAMRFRKEFSQGNLNTLGIRYMFD